MSQLEKRKNKKRKERQRTIEVWTPEEFLSRTSWYRFGPHSPKRQAYEIIKRLLADMEAFRCSEPVANPSPPITWAQKVKH